MTVPKIHENYIENTKNTWKIHEKYMKNKISTLLIITLGLVALIALLQPVWRGEEMVAELKSDCDKRGGIILEHEKMFVINYECVSRLD